jgi:signal peptidase I
VTDPRPRPLTLAPPIESQRLDPSSSSNSDERKPPVTTEMSSQNPPGDSDPGPTEPTPETPNFEFPSKRVLSTERSKESRTRSVVEWVVVIGGALALALLAKFFLVQVFWIPSGSMEHTLDIGDRVIVNKLSYKLHDINRGDIVVFERPEDQNEEIKDLIKRVVALPGEEVAFDGGHVYINGELLNEPYLADGVQSTGHTYGNACTPEQPCKVPEGDIWVMGDNRSNSKDSTYFGPIDEDDVVGRAFFRIWPLDRFGFL